MNRFNTIILLLLCLCPFLNAQTGRLERYDFTVSSGITQFFGDLGGYPTGHNNFGLKDFTWQNTRYNVSAGMRYWFTENLSARFEATYGKFHSTDSYGPNKRRGFSSTTEFLEPALKGEFHLLRNNFEYSVALKNLNKYTFRSVIHLIDPYLFAGIGALSYKVSPNDSLASRATVKGGFTPVIPAGIGANLIYSWNFNIGLELGGRYSLSDNIDGFTSATSKAKDIYYFMNVVVTWKIRKGLKSNERVGK